MRFSHDSGSADAFADDEPAKPEQSDPAPATDHDEDEEDMMAVDAAIEEFEPVQIPDETLAQGEVKIATEGTDKGSPSPALSSSPSPTPSPSPTLTPSPSPNPTPTPSPAPSTPASTPELEVAALIPEEAPVIPDPEDSVESTPAPSTAPPKDDGSWPSSSFSGFNFPLPGETWYSNPEMGAGKNYPGISEDCDTNTDRDQGIRGPAAPVGLSAPVPARISSHFGWRQSGERMHYGLDYAAAQGTPIQAAGRGTVTWYTTESSGTYGKVVEIHHGGGFTSLYAHCDSIAVKEGDHVEKGDVIGTVGSSAASAIHLHFEIRHNGIPYNPLFYIG